MSMSREQLGLIHMMAHNAGLDTRKDRADYELVLTNVAGVTTSKDLTQASFEDVMATLEDLADQRGADVGTYWRDTQSRRGTTGTSRMVWKIGQLHAQYESLKGDADPHYELAGLAARISGKRTADVHQLRRREAWSLIEALKGIIDRLQPERTAGVSPAPAEAVPF